MIELRSTEDLYAQITDCRSVTLYGTYYDLLRDKASNLFRDFYSFVNDRLSADCILDWTMDNRAVKDLDASLRGDSSPYRSLYVEGKVSGSIVRNKTTMRKFMRDSAYDPVFMQGLAPSDASVDYVYKRICFLDRYENDPERYREALSHFFLYDFPYLQQYRMWDIRGFVDSSPMAEGSDNVRGRFSIGISFACLKNGPDETAECFRAFAERLSETYINISIAVGSESQCRPVDFPDYLFYFMGYDDPTDFNALLREQALWTAAEYLYMKKVGWVNILSPAAAGLLETGPRFSAEGPNVLREPLRHGGVEIRCAKRFSETKMTDYRQLKAAMYGSLYPGKSSITIGPDPELRFLYLRTRWECVPILEQELSIDGRTIRFRHLGTLDRELVADIFCLPRA